MTSGASGVADRDSTTSPITMEQKLQRASQVLLGVLSFELPEDGLSPGIKCHKEDVSLSQNRPQADERHAQRGTTEGESEAIADDDSPQ